MSYWRPPSHRIRYQKRASLLGHLYLIHCSTPNSRFILSGTERAHSACWMSKLVLRFPLKKGVEMGKKEGEKRRPLYRLSPLPSLLLSIGAERRLHQTRGNNCSLGWSYLFWEVEWASIAELSPKTQSLSLGNMEKFKVPLSVILRTEGMREEKQRTQVKHLELWLQASK